MMASVPSSSRIRLLCLSSPASTSSVLLWVNPDQEYTFTSIVSPTSHPPLTYVWTPEPVSGQGTDSATYSWTRGGKKTIMLAINDNIITLTATHLIDLPVIYLPIVRK